VTLDLNGFTISSTAASANGNGIYLPGNTDITILNGHIVGGVTNTPGSYAGPGFANGIMVNLVPVNIRVSGVSVSGCLGNGIYLKPSPTALVEYCTVTIASGTGISAGTVTHCTADICAEGILASTVSDCNAYAYSSNGRGIAATVANNCNGSAAGYGDGVNATSANNCYGSCNGNGVGVGGGINAVNANNCYGINSGAGNGILVSGTANNCYGSCASGVGINAHIAIGCTLGSGTETIAFKYNMP
jgi:hypothetical protein